MELHCWGISHKSTSLEVREKFAFNKKEIDEVLTNLKMTNTFDNGILLSTCNRTEFYSVCLRSEIKNFEKVVSKILNKFENLRKNDQYLYAGPEAFKHSLKVMTGIDSMIIGEPDIFGQVKKSLNNSRSMGFLNAELENTFNNAIRFSKLIRTETDLSKNPLSISTIVEGLISEEDEIKSVLVIGGGDVARKLVPKLIKKEKEVFLLNRSNVEISGIKSDSLSKIKTYLKKSDAVVIVASSNKNFIEEDFLSKIQKNILVFDLAIPRNISFKIPKNKNVTVITLDELGEMMKKNEDTRKEEVDAAKEIIKLNADKEFRKLKNKQMMGRNQKEAREKIFNAKTEALKKAKSSLKKGIDVEKVLEELANEIASKNAHELSKIIDDPSIISFLKKAK
jgi:glutamyl-tRNA reductase